MENFNPDKKEADWIKSKDSAIKLTLPQKETLNYKKLSILINTFSGEERDYVDSYINCLKKSEDTSSIKTSLSQNDRHKVEKAFNPYLISC